MKGQSSGSHARGSESVLGVKKLSALTVQDGHLLSRLFFPCPRSLALPSSSSPTITTKIRRPHWTTPKKGQSECWRKQDKALDETE
eukprot:1917648-Rhodomonas_salina.2